MRKSKLHQTLVCIVSAVGVLAFGRPAFAYRTAQDSNELSGAGRVAWSGGEPAFVLSRALLPDGVAESAVEQAVLWAFEKWAEPACTTVRPQLVGWVDVPAAPEDGVNTLQWIEKWPDEFPASAPGYTDLEYRNSNDIWELSEADVYLNASLVWSESDAVEASLSLAAVLTHEFGHALGLLHPCEPSEGHAAPVCGAGGAVEAETTMFPEYFAAQETLAPDDIAGICFLYPTCGGCPDGEVCHEGECRVICDGTVCDSGLACGRWGCALADACLEGDCTGMPCSSDLNCAPLGVCATGACVRGDRPFGGACALNSDCANGACVAGVCEPLCSTDLDCNGGSCAESEGPPAMGCIDARAYPQGSQCRDGEDCITGLCLFEGGRGVCARSCEENGECASGDCMVVDEQAVCVPSRLRSSGGCSIAARSASPFSFPLVLLFGTFALLGRRQSLGRKPWL